MGPRSRKDTTVASTSTRTILRAMEAAGVHRFTAVSAAPVGPTPEDDSFVNRRILYPVIKSLFREIYADLARMEDEIRRSGTEWTIVRPPRLTDKPRTGSYRTAIGANVPLPEVVSWLRSFGFVQSTFPDGQSMATISPIGP